MTAALKVAGPDERYRKSERLLKRADFLRVQHQGLRYTTPRFVVLSLPSPTGHRRFGITASTKVGNAIQRNRVKRRLRDIYRRNRGSWPAGIDIVIIARHAAADARFDELEADFFAWAKWFERRQSKAETR